MLIDIEVTQSMIDEGQQWPGTRCALDRSLTCPLARAFKAAGFQKAIIGLSYLGLEIGDFLILMPEDMRVFRRNADHHPRGIKPSKFKIEIPDDLVAKHRHL